MVLLMAARALRAKLRRIASSNANEDIVNEPLAYQVAFATRSMWAARV